MLNIKEILKERILSESVDNIFTEEIFDNLQISFEEYKKDLTKSGFKNIKILEKKYKKYYTDFFNCVFADLDLNINELEKLNTLTKQNFINKEHHNTFRFDEMLQCFNAVTLKYIITKKIKHIDYLFEENKIDEAYSYVYQQKHYSKLMLYLMTLIIKTNNFERHFKEDIVLNSINRTINRDLIFLYTEIGVSEVFQLYNNFKYMIFTGENREIGCDIEEKDFYKLEEYQKEEMIKELGKDICLSSWFTFNIKIIEKYIPKLINERIIKVLAHDKIEPFLCDFEESGLFILTKIYQNNNPYFWYIMSLINKESYKLLIIEKVKTKLILDNF